MARSRAKKWFGFIHLWVGLITGLLVFLISITGSIYVFRDELYNLLHSDVQVNNNSTGKKPLPLSRLWAAAQQHLGDSMPVEDAITYNAPNRNWEFNAGKRNDSAITYFGWIEYDYIVYVNPYTAQVAGVVNHKLEFFQLIKMFHWSLLLHTGYGQPIVGTAVLLFLLSLLSGLIIWWPKGGKQFKESLKVKWKARWRRINYDIHRTIGFYALIPALIIAITGLVWAFKWMQALVYVAAAQSVTPPEKRITQSVYDTVTCLSETALMDHTAATIFERYPQAHSFGFYPTTRNDTAGTFNAYIRTNGMVYYNAISENYDQYNGKLLHTTTFDNLNRGEKIIYMNYDIHVGQVLGIPGKILALLASLICAMLPVTGFLIWWGKRTVAEGKKVKYKTAARTKAMQRLNV